ncbi:hypothetical protein [Eisenibacter elegans]|jgi:hypothetical protein|uniref:hypothetical protein n=1 Tax=Eisenibacter elegans TaxID=997 RepID=UPI00047E6C31|nr:hypothetical protein [Eisenibacter elegans]
MNSLARLLFLFLILWAVDAHAQDTPWDTLRTAQYQICYPADWQLDQSGLMGTHFIVFDQVQPDGFRPNVNLTVQQFPTENAVGLGEIAELSLTQIKNFITDAKILYANFRQQDTDQLYEVIFSGTQGIQKLLWRQHYYLKQGKIYVLTYTNTLEAYMPTPQTQALAEAILLSFALR